MEKKRTKDILDIGSASLGNYGTGQVARILGVEIWRVQNYLDSPKYRISPEGQPLGSGRGSRRVFTDTDVFRLAVADHLVQNGYSYKYVSGALQHITDEDLLGRLGDEGEELDLVYMLVGGEKDLRVEEIRRDKTIRELLKRAKSPSFYLLDLSSLVIEIQKRMRG